MLFAIASVANAETITYKSVGTVSSIEGFDFGCSVEIGGQFTSCATVEVVPPADPSLTSNNYYPLYHKYVVGNCEFEEIAPGPSGVGYLIVHNDHDDYDDLIWIDGPLTLLPDQYLAEYADGSTWWQDNDREMLASVSLPTADTNFENADIRIAGFHAYGETGDPEAFVTAAMDSFYVSPTGCGATLEELLGALIDYVAGIEGLQVGVTNSLDIKLQLILETVAYIQGNNINSAVAQIYAFIHEVEQQIGTNITEAQGQYMLAIAYQILEKLEAL